MEFNATFIVAFFSFIIFTFVMNLILYKPINDVVEKRKKLVESNYDEADKNSKQKTEVLRKRDEKMANAANEARQLIEQKTSEANDKKKEITAKAKDEAQKNIDNYNIYYKNATAQAKEALHNDVVGLAQIISDKLLGANEQISEDEYKDLLNTVIKG